MTRGVHDVATVVAALSRAVGTALDPSSIVSRAVGALAPAMTLGDVELWRPTGRGLALVATHPVRGDDGGAPAHGAGITLALESQGQALGHLVVHAAPGHPLNDDDLALLDIAASQVAGALERSQLFAEVMELERLKSDFISRVSHELRTPITIITGFLETLISHDAKLDGEQRLHMLERSRVASARLGQLIEELLILSRLESGVLTPQPEPLTVADVLESVRAAAIDPDVVVVTEPFGPQVITDRALFISALGFVVDNAIKYGDVAELSTTTGAGRWSLEVRDRGPGFAEDIRGTAFEMFTRSPSTSAVPGLGVGLAIARTLIEVLDGTISLEDAAPGPGALVRITLPA